VDPEKLVNSLPKILEMLKKEVPSLKYPAAGGNEII